MGIATEEVHPDVQRLLARQGEWPAQQSEAWWSARQAMLTASDVAAVLGTSPFASAFIIPPQRTAALCLVRDVAEG